MKGRNAMDWKGERDTREREVREGGERGEGER